MQYNTQWIFHLNPYPGPILHKGGKHGTCDLFPLGLLLHGFLSTSFDISDDVSHRPPISCCCWTHSLRPCRIYKSHTGRPSRAVSTASSISNRNERRKIKQNMKLSLWGQDFTDCRGVPLVPLIIHSPESGQSFKTSLVWNKNFPSTLSTHFLYLH